MNAVFNANHTTFNWPVSGIRFVGSDVKNIASGKKGDETREPVAFYATLRAAPH